MGWNEVDNKLKKGHDALFVTCEESFETEYLIEAVTEEFPHFSKADVKAAVKSCCNSVPAPRSRDTYVKCLKSQLGF